MTDTATTPNATIRRAAGPDEREPAPEPAPELGEQMTRGDLRAWLTERGRDRFLPGDVLRPDVEHEVFALVRQHRSALGLPVAGYGPPTAADANAALDWRENEHSGPNRGGEV